MPDAYVELHAASAFSFLRGASLPEQLAEEAARLELPALALLDRDGVYGAPRLYAAGREAKIRPLVGAEVTMEDGSVVPLLVENRQGYQNLCQLISNAKLEARAPGLQPADQPPGVEAHARKRPCFATWADLARHAAGLIALTGDEAGPIQRRWADSGAGGVAAAIGRLTAIFGTDRLFVEVQRHRVRGEETTLRMLTDLAAAHRLPLLATGGALHATRAGRDVTDVFTCLRHHTTLDGAGRLLTPNAARHLRSGRLMKQLFADLPGAVANSARLAQRLTFTLSDLDYQFPDFPVGAGETMEGVLRERTFAGAQKRFPAMTDRVKAQLERELALINKLEFAGYFLIVWDICEWARERQILIQGRGSAANSAVCYALGITAVDPIKQDLLFERFLSEGRGEKGGPRSWPDIDLDLPSGDLRESVIQEIYTRYSRRGAAMVANVITYRGRSAAREVGKVLGLTEDVLDRFSALYANGDFPHTMGLPEQLSVAGLAGTHPRLPAMVSLCSQLASLPRHLGQHSGGMVLCPGRLDRVVPIEPASMPDRTIVQWDKDDCEDLGLVKIDFLGLGMMAVLQDCQRLCRERGRPIELHAMPHDDQVFALMQKADTIGVFQIESRAQMATLPRLKPATFYDVAIAVAIVRPGPITGGLTSPLIRRRAGLEPVVCIDPDVHEKVKGILGRTCGVILFQEQMLGLAMELAGFTGGEAEELRRALGFHRNNERLLRVTAKLRDALRARHYREEVVIKVVDACASFALYGFPESHAISFALLAYASTWLKLNRAAEFYASLLNNQPMGFYSPATLVQDGRRRERPLKFRPICVQHSDWDCTVEADDVVRIGLRYIKGLREVHAREIVAQRQIRPFASLADFLRRTTGSAAERRALAAIGALNALASHRRAALWQVEAAWSSAETLFQHAGGLLDDCDLGALAPMTLGERVQADYQASSLTVGDHPMSLVRGQIPEVWRASDLPLARDGDIVVIGGSVICRQRPGTAKGIVFISLEDETGVANAVVSSELFERCRMVINEEPTLRITGRLQNREGVIHLRAEKIEPLLAGALPVQASHDFR